MQILTLPDGVEAFSVSIHEAAASAPAALFAAGAGGQPERYSTLLAALIESGCTVIAPHFERLTSLFPSEAELTLRARRLSLALNSTLRPGQTAVGVGHSIGATLLVALAGGQIWLGPGRKITIEQNKHLTRLALLTPPTGFFQAPEALDVVRTPILAWAGAKDDVTPPVQTEWLAHAMRDQQTVDVRITEGAGHSHLWIFRHRMPWSHCQTSQHFFENIRRRFVSS